MRRARLRGDGMAAYPPGAPRLRCRSARSARVSAEPAMAATDKALDRSLDLHTHTLHDCQDRASRRRIGAKQRYAALR